MSNHTVRFNVTVYMEDMTGSVIQSAQIADEQVESALLGKESEYGLPGMFTVTVTDYRSEPERVEDDTYA